MKNVLTEQMSAVTPSPPSLPLFNCFVLILQAIHFYKSQQTNPIEWTRVNREYIASATGLLFVQKPVTTTCDVNKVYPVRLFVNYSDM
jgi:hypothetical protein